MREDWATVPLSPATVTDVASGTPLLVDVERGRGSTLYALSQGQWNGAFPGLPAIPNDGALLRVNADGTIAVVIDGLDLPTSLEIINNTAYVITLTGTAMKFPGIAEPPYGGSRKAVSVREKPGQEKQVPFQNARIIYREPAKVSSDSMFEGREHWVRPRFHSRAWQRADIQKGGGPAGRYAAGRPVETVAGSVASRKGTAVVTEVTAQTYAPGRHTVESAQGGGK